MRNAQKWLSASGATVSGGNRGYAIIWKFCRRAIGRYAPTPDWRTNPSKNTAKGWIVDVFLNGSPESVDPDGIAELKAYFTQIRARKRRERLAKLAKLAKAEQSPTVPVPSRPVLLALPVHPAEPKFLQTMEWRRARYDALKRHGRRCQCCGATPATGAVMNVDHILPRKTHPQLALDPENLQVLCADCNAGKGNRDTTDWRTNANERDGATSPRVH